MPAPSLELVPLEGQPPPAPQGWPQAWPDAWRSAVEAGFAQLGTLSALWDPRSVRERWLADLRQLSSEVAGLPGLPLALMKVNLAPDDRQGRASRQRTERTHQQP